jgi:hypothetical protein
MYSFSSIVAMLGWLVRMTELISACPYNSKVSGVGDYSRTLAQNFGA